ncbi:alpha-1-antitrypsin homolog [Sander lucioperca]|uniref:alpha-1-antitrypsin homolog n=1 Tax=Sander lucioperca TaxID=283035 RepID=UPI00125D7A6F|nr:alpha-1-antitrypsin homolog [Sander lucioperca]
MFLQRANNTSQENASEGTAVFVGDRFKPKPEFLQTLKQSCFTDGFNVDFSQTTESADIINKYVEGKTNGKIDKLVENLDPDTVMYLISYIYYKGKWATPFDPKLTRQDNFNVDENTTVPAIMMNMEERFHIYHDRELRTTVLQLPFNSSYSMLLMLPDVMSTLENAISPNHVTKWLKAMVTHRRYNVYIPKFSIKASYTLNDVLSEMGMTDMFGDRANLRGISEEQRLAVSDVSKQSIFFMLFHTFQSSVVSLSLRCTAGWAQKYAGCGRDRSHCCGHQTHRHHTDICPPGPCVEVQSSIHGHHH